MALDSSHALLQLVESADTEEVYHNLINFLLLNVATPKLWLILREEKPIYIIK